MVACKELKCGAGDGDRTRNIQLGKVTQAFFIFNTYKKCLGKINVMRCLICVSLRLEDDLQCQLSDPGIGSCRNGPKG